jgi:glycosyltransferase involved in cell wall biosynthesis
LSDPRIAVSYAGVHQAIQLALAAHEIAELKAFYCTLYDDPAKWGYWFAGFIGPRLSEGRRADGLDLRRVIEFPWPLLLKVMRDRIYSRAIDNWFVTNSAFDWWASRRIAADRPEIFVGTASSDLFSLQRAKALGATLLHDCPGAHPVAAAALFREAAEKAKFQIRRRRPWPQRTAMRSRILREYDLADILLVYSAFHRKGFEDAGFPRSRLFLSPLWVDAEFWRRTQPNTSADVKRDVPLKLLFVGSIDLRKGIPFLLEAVAQCGKAVHLTIVGSRTAETYRVIGRDPDNVTYLPHQPQSELHRIYEAHDVLVHPSVCDPFPRVVMEAMACGLPVILTDNCGTPVPDASWRVPAMNSERLAQRIMQYADDRALVALRGDQASVFAARFTPSAYRRNIQGLFQEVLAARR